MARRRLVEFLMFNLLTLVWLEPGLLNLSDVLFGKLVFLLSLLCFGWFARTALGLPAREARFTAIDYA